MIFIVVNCRVAVFENIFKEKGRKKMKKRLLALLLALVMVVALLPTIALAADSGNTLQFSTDLRPEYCEPVPMGQLYLEYRRRDVYPGRWVCKGASRWDKNQLPVVLEHHR